MVEVSPAKIWLEKCPVTTYQHLNFRANDEKPQRLPYRVPKCLQSKELSKRPSEIPIWVWDIGINYYEKNHGTTVKMFMGKLQDS